VFVDDVLKEEADAALATLAAARAEVVKQEAAVRSIAAALAHRKSYRHAEVASVALNTMPWPEAKPNPAPYLTLAERLTVDADATVLP
jgi:phosphoglycolate phosphatase-like HAD superfamily hydrolase